MRRAGKPLRPAYLLNALRKAGMFNDRVSSRCIALVDAHMKSNMYTLLEFSNDPFWSPVSRTHNGPAKSNPTLVKGGSSDNLLAGRSGGVVAA